MQVPKDEPNGENNSDRPDRLAIGGSNGFQVYVGKVIQINDMQEVASMTYLALSNASCCSCSLAAYLADSDHFFPLLRPLESNVCMFPPDICDFLHTLLKVGGDKCTVERSQWLVSFPENLRIPLPRPELPMVILNTLAAISVSSRTPS